MAKVKRSFSQQVTDTDMPTKFYRSGMAIAVTVIMAFGGWYFNKLTTSVDNIADRVSGIERKQDKTEFIMNEFSKKFDEFQKEIRKLQK